MNSRKIYSQDEEILARFFEENNTQDTTSHFTAFPLNRDSAHKIANYPGKDQFYLVWEGETPIGFWMLRGWNEGYSIPSFGVFVGRSHRQKGIGRKIVQEACEIAVKLNCPEVRLTVYQDNPAAIHLYQSEGFSILSEEGEEKKKWVLNKHL